MTVVKQSFVQPPGPRNPSPVPVTNLVATLRGTQAASADRVYVVSGHYDSRCTDVLNFTCDAPGADDDASGVAAVLELARVMAKRQFDATIVFMAVAGEEQGLYGSTFFAAQAKAQNMDIEGMFTNDIIGSSTNDHGQRDPFTVRLFSEGVPTSETPEQAALRQSIGGENDGPSRQLARYVKEVGENSATDMHVRLVWRRDRYLRGGDQIPFLEQGYPAARFTEPAEDFRHQHQDARVEDGVQFGDLPQFVDYGFTARVARVNGATLANLALAPTSPKEAKIVTTSRGRRTRSPTSPATRSCGASRPTRCGRTRSRSATSRATRSRGCRRTTSRSGSGPWTATGSGAPSRSQCRSPRTWARSAATPRTWGRRGSRRPARGARRPRRSWRCPGRWGR